MKSVAVALVLCPLYTGVGDWSFCVSINSSLRSVTNDGVLFVCVVYSQTFKPPNGFCHPLLLIQQQYERDLLIVGISQRDSWYVQLLYTRYCVLLCLG